MSNQEQEVVGAESPVEFEYGDLHVKCSCGHDNLVHANISTGINLYLINRSDSYIKLQCEECNHLMEMMLLPAINPPIQDVEPIVEEVVEPIETQDEHQEINTEE